MTTKRTKDRPLKPRQVSPPPANNGEPEAILATMCPALAEQYQEITRWFRTEDHFHLKARHDLGKLVEQIRKDEEQRGNAGRYGSGAMDKVYKALGEERKRERQEVLRFYQEFTSEELKQLGNRQLADGRTLSYSLLRQLAAVKERDKRQELLEKAIAKSFTAVQLGKEIQTVFGHQKTAQGNKPKKPGTFDTAVRQQAAAIDAVLNRAAKVWANDECSLRALAQNVTADKVTTEKAEELKARMAEWRELMRIAEAQVAEAEQVYERFLAILRNAQSKEPVPDKGTGEERKEDALELEKAAA